MRLKLVCNQITMEETLYISEGEHVHAQKAQRVVGEEISR